MIVSVAFARFPRSARAPLKGFIASSGCALLWSMMTHTGMGDTDDKVVTHACHQSCVIGRSERRKIRHIHMFTVSAPASA
jgi:hypothetical protein